MNSFNTDDDTKKIIRKYQGFRVQIYTFNQSCFPRINRESFLPVAKHLEVESNMEAYVKYKKCLLLKMYINRKILFYSFLVGIHQDMEIFM